MIQKAYLFPGQWIVITGAAGLIGSAIVRYLNDCGQTNLILVDNIGKTEKWKNLSNKRFIDLISIEGIWSWLQNREKQIAAWIHLGGCSDTCELDVDYLLENNYRYTQRLATYALNHGHRFIYASSAATYGDGKEGFSDNYEKLYTLRPLNPYGYSKHLIDLWAYESGFLDRLVSLKYFNVFGPNEGHKGAMASMVYKMFPLVRREGVIRLFKSSEPSHFGDGEQCRDFLYVKEAARMTCSFLNDQRVGIYNIGRGEAITWNRLAHALFNALQMEPRIEYQPMPPQLASCYQNYTCADMHKWPKEWQWNYTIEEAVGDYVQNHLLKEEVW
jgi:ADP-L-glycero-D-manno-heptose 6-epimerase